MDRWTTMRTAHPVLGSPRRSGTLPERRAARALSREGVERQDGESRIARLADERLRREVAALIPAALDAYGYDGLTYRLVSRLTGADSALLAVVFPSKAEMVLEALRPPAASVGRSAFTLPGEQIVAHYLELWETGDNRVVMRSVLCASGHDEQLASVLEQHIFDVIVGPFVEAAPTVDAHPRARLALSQLLGLAVSRYLLGHEPLASADIETIAAWVGPSVDYFLRGELGCPYAAPSTPASPATRPAATSATPVVALRRPAHR